MFGSKAISNCFHSVVLSRPKIKLMLSLLHKLSKYHLTNYDMTPRSRGAFRMEFMDVLGLVKLHKQITHSTIHLLLNLGTEPSY